MTRCRHRHWGLGPEEQRGVARKVGNVQELGRWYYGVLDPALPARWLSPAPLRRHRRRRGVHSWGIAAPHRPRPCRDRGLEGS